MKIFRRNILQHEKCCPLIQVAFIPLVFVKASAPVRSQSGAVVAARGWSCFLVLLRSCIEYRMEVQSPGRHVQGICHPINSISHLMGDETAKPPDHKNHLKFKFQPKRFFIDCATTQEENTQKWRSNIVHTKSEGN